jgi:hypothetical protein
MKTINKIMMIILVIQILLFLSGCNKKPTEPGIETKLKLTLEDASCTEAWIKLTSSNISIGQSTIIQVLKNGNVAQTISLLSADTVLYVDSLLPNQSYRIQAKVQVSNKTISSNELSVTTMDTTSHNFTWQSWEFGQHSSSTLFDVAIIDENNIWAVGKIYMKDSLGRPDPNAYNAVHWDGTKWELKRIYTYSNCSSVDYAPLKSIFAFSPNKIVVTSGGGMWWFDGDKWTAECSINPLLTGAINKLWGSSSNDLYVVGNSGNIAHWDGRKWTKIESGTNLHIYDIWGDYNEKTGQWEILAVAANVYNSLEKEVLKIKNSQSYKLSNFGIEEPLRGVWFKCNRKYYLVGSGTYMKTFLTENEWKGNPRDITNYFENAIRANSTNDVIVVGAFGEVLQFNGYSWKSFINQTYLPSGTYLSVDVKGNILVAVGWNSRQAIITTGRK